MARKREITTTGITDFVNYLRDSVLTTLVKDAASSMVELHRAIADDTAGWRRSALNSLSRNTNSTHSR